MQAAKHKRLESQEARQKKNLLYLLKPDLLKTYQKNEVKKALIMKKQRERCKGWLILKLTYEICAHYKRCLENRKEEIEIQERRWKASLTIVMLCSKFFRRFNYEDRMRNWVKSSVMLLYQCEHERRQEQAQQLVVKFIQGYNFQRVFLSRTIRLIDAVNMIQNYWRTHRAELKSISAIVKK